MTGFRIDPEALEAAIRELEDARDQAFKMTRSVQSAMPGELTAKDSITSGARELFRDRANGADASLQMAAGSIVDKLNAKIEAYRDTLDEYRLAEDNASVDASRVDGRS
ncbi:MULTISPECIES: hypothetical protein [unclassified Saccharopolyspora]|uniref:hypothetical protein n=1 Tax=unclassified Saccharopolyspora TaxID=2646250 RepID=UPI001CD23750|nr:MULTISPECIES: hypothetical protein [unclassified Saccharopolyspora]MCA1189411.1 hypothetical protein [Saccharopolyspora sp. 6T]MCA1282668.1 hypothetical protein [Saccharopolyspora sp. 7B]